LTIFPVKPRIARRQLTAGETPELCEARNSRRTLRRSAKVMWIVATVVEVEVDIEEEEEVITTGVEATEAVIEAEVEAKVLLTWLRPLKISILILQTTRGSSELKNGSKECLMKKVEQETRVPTQWTRMTFSGNCSSPQSIL